MPNIRNEKFTDIYRHTMKTDSISAVNPWMEIYNKT